MFLERIKFYADTPHNERNKFFCFKLTSILSLEAAVYRFYGNGFNFRAVWYEKLDCETGKIMENIRIPDSTLQELYEKFNNLSTKQKKLYLNVQLKSSN